MLYKLEIIAQAVHADRRIQVVHNDHRGGATRFAVDEIVRLMTLVFVACLHELPRVVYPSLFRAHFICHENCANCRIRF